MLQLWYPLSDHVLHLLGSVCNVYRCPILCAAHFLQIQVIDWLNDRLIDHSSNRQFPGTCGLYETSYTWIWPPASPYTTLSGWWWLRFSPYFASRHRRLIMFSSMLDSHSYTHPHVGVRYLISVNIPSDAVQRECLHAAILYNRRFSLDVRRGHIFIHQHHVWLPRAACAPVDVRRRRLGFAWSISIN